MRNRSRGNPISAITVHVAGPDSDVTVSNGRQAACLGGTGFGFASIHSCAPGLTEQAL